MHSKPVFGILFVSVAFLASAGTTLADGCLSSQLSATNQASLQRALAQQRAQSQLGYQRVTHHYDNDDDHVTVVVSPRYDTIDQQIAALAALIKAQNAAYAQAVSEEAVLP
ncbi:hypothetical protein A8950_1191 [Dongia mobilis]|uniref:Uncharacterized protein n=1 Tax=Dongia mobilis TaxID=578943 RepID=A0A4V3DEY0_9PROT|nr:hypothetical protein [Dongia mobilis]TDQ82910.1 hypothetical protein A8950_1191 [Dongia mobilis]